MEFNLENLKKNESTVADFDNFYDQQIKAFSGNVDDFNQVINQLKTICIERSIDHTRYFFKEVAVALPVQPKLNKKPTQPIKEEELKVLQSATIDAIDLEKLLKSYDESFSFLPYLLVRQDGLKANAPERLLVVYSNILEDHSVESIFSPDKVIGLDKFNAKELDANFSWVILALFPSSDKNCRTAIKGMLSNLPDAKVFNRYDFENREDSYWKKDRSNVFNKTLSDNTCLLVHHKFDAEREYLIKDLFGSKVGYLLCSRLKSGFSGSDVLLVSPEGGVGDKRKYVLKISDKTDNKLQKERENYRNFVEPFWNENQQITAEWVETSRYQMIRYPFASVDTISKSISLSEKYKKTESPQHIKEIINKIFDHKLQTRWRSDCKLRKAKFIEMFSDLLNWEKSKPEMEKILKLNPDVSISISEIEIIFEREIEFWRCINHGDFHSDNIQVQDGPNPQIFLIDFGETERFPAGLDYALLEASIRFKLLDYSIDPKILQEVDLSRIQSFDGLIKIEEEFENDAHKAAKTISTIREKFLNDFTQYESAEKLRRQYLYCLLAVCLRQVAYPDLNRRYILQTIRSVLDSLIV